MKTEQYNKKLEEIEAQIANEYAQFDNRSNVRSSVHNNKLLDRMEALDMERTQLFYKWAAGPQD
jgi:hypothetical protein